MENFVSPSLFQTIYSYLDGPIKALLIVVIVFLLAKNIDYFIKHRIQIKEISKQQWLWELRAFLTSMLVDIIFVVLLTRVFTFRFDASSGPIETTIFVTLMIFWYDAWFYFGHRWFHTKKLYSFHHQHHRSVVTTPLTAHSFSALERIYLNIGIALPVLTVQSLVPIPIAGLVIFVFWLNTWNTVGHSNVEVVPQSLRYKIPFKYFVTPTYHSAHHFDSKGNYGLVFVFWDKFFKTNLNSLKVHK